MSEFFAAGGFGMFPVLLFGFLSVASAVLFLLRPERRYVGLMVALGITTLAASLLGLSIGLIGVFRYVEKVAEADRVKMITLGISDSLHVPALALILLVITGIVASIGAFRATRLPAPTTVVA